MGFFFVFNKKSNWVKKVIGCLKMRSVISILGNSENMRK